MSPPPKSPTHLKSATPPPRLLRETSPVADVDEAGASLSAPMRVAQIAKNAAKTTEGENANKTTDVENATKTSEERLCIGIKLHI